MNYRAFFEGKKITMLGLGLLGRGVGDAEFLAKCGVRVFVTDKKSAEELVPSVRRLEKYPNVQFVLGRHRKRDFKNCDFVLKAAGVPLNSPYIAEAEKNGVPVYMSTALFASLLPEEVTTIGVTGTRGKSTTTHLIFESLKKAGRRVHLGGNVRGVSTLALLPRIQDGDFVVLELDSWQLQGFGESKTSPHIAVFTNLLDDHLNYYSDKKTYFGDKANIFQFQKAGDVFIAGEAVAREWIAHTNPPIQPIAPDVLPKTWKLKLIGEHNRENAALAAEALRAVGLSDDEIKNGVESVEPIEGRMQCVYKNNDVRIFNDNNATTPDATIAALRTLGNTKQKNIILIMGGADKGLDASALAKEIPKHCKAMVLLPGSGTERFMKHESGIMNTKAMIHNSKFIIQKARTLKEAINQAMRCAQKGDVVLFSPAFASFGMFKNEYDRGEQFLDVVSGL